MVLTFELLKEETRRELYKASGCSSWEEWGTIIVIIIIICPRM